MTDRIHASYWLETADDPRRAAELIAGRLGLEYHFRHTGYGGLEHSLRRFVAREAQI